MQLAIAQGNHLCAAAAHIHIQGAVHIGVSGKCVGVKENLRFFQPADDIDAQACFFAHKIYDVLPVGGIAHGAGGADAVVVNPVGPHDVGNADHGVHKGSLLLFRDGPVKENIRPKANGNAKVGIFFDWLVGTQLFNIADEKAYGVGAHVNGGKHAGFHSVSSGAFNT